MSDEAARTAESAADLHGPALEVVSVRRQQQHRDLIDALSAALAAAGVPPDAQVEWRDPAPRVL